MNISGPFIKRPVMTTLVMAAILFFGILAWAWLPRSDLPSVAYPTIQIDANNPGSDPLTMAATIATPLEQQIMTTPGIQSVLSTSSQGTTTITVTFDLDQTEDGAITDIAAAINRAMGDLPKEMPNPPQYRLFNPAATPNIFLHVSSESATEADLYDYANNVLAEQISMVQGVAKVDIYGTKRAIRVKLNPNKLAALGLSPTEVADQVYQASQTLPAGQLYDTYQNWYLEPKGQLLSGEAYQNLIIRYDDYGPLRLRDIGHAYDSTEYDTFNLVWWDAETGNIPSVVLAVTKEDGANAIKMCDTVIGMLPRLESMLPASVEVGVAYNFAVMIRGAILDVEFTLILAFVLVVMVIFLFLGSFRTTLIPSITLPLSIFATFMLMFILGYSIDILSMLALTLVVGFLVDDAIVVLENNTRHLDMGKPALDATLDGSAQISTTILSMTLSLAAVFIPLIFMPGIIGRMFHEFGMVVVIAVLFSGFLSLTLTPMMCARILKRKAQPGRLERWSHNLTAWLLALYTPALKWVLKRRWIPLSLGVLTFGIALLLFAITPQDFLPPGDTGVIQGITLGNQNISPELMNEYGRQALEIVRQNPAVGSGVSATNIPNFLAPNEGALFINLKPWSKRPSIEKVTREIQTALEENLTGAQVFLKPLPEINLNVGVGPTRADYTYFLSTVDDAESLYAATGAFIEKLRTIPEIIEVSTDMQIDTAQLEIEILRDRASSYGVTLESIEKALGYAYAEGQLNLYNTQLNVYQVIVQMLDEYKTDPDSLAELWIAPSDDADSTQLIPLSELVNWKRKAGPLTVNHLNQFVSTTVFFNVAPGAALGTALQKVEEAAQEIIPPNILKQFVGTAQIFKGTMTALVILMVMGIFTIYLILGILYESFIHPITILSALPGALFGAMVTLVLFGETLSIYAYVGMIVLIGIVMKNGIMLVEFAKENRAMGKSAYEAIIDAARIRFRPILMTTIAAAMGAVPIALGLSIGGGADADSRRPLGLIILGGLLCAQFITYFFTPVIYLYFEEMTTRRHRRKAKKP